VEALQYVLNEKADEPGKKCGLIKRKRNYSAKINKIKLDKVFRQKSKNSHTLLVSKYRY
jgi:hypothetical protein